MNTCGEASSTAAPAAARPTNNRQRLSAVRATSPTARPSHAPRLKVTAMPAASTTATAAKEQALSRRDPLQSQARGKKRSQQEEGSEPVGILDDRIGPRADRLLVGVDPGGRHGGIGRVLIEPVQSQEQRGGQEDGHRPAHDPPVSRQQETQEVEEEGLERDPQGEDADGLGHLAQNDRANGGHHGHAQG